MLTLLSPGPSAAQDPTTMGMSDLQALAGEYVGREEFVPAVPYLSELAARLRDAPEEQRASLEGILFFLGLGHMGSYANRGDDALRDAIAAFSEYDERYPSGDRLHFALMNQADCHRAMRAYRPAAASLVKLLSPPVSFRYNDESFRIDGLEKLAGCYYLLEEWEAGLPWFRQLLTATADQRLQALAAAALMRSHIEAGRFEEVFPLLRYLVADTPPRYEVSFNAALIRGGDRLQKLGRIAEAALLYHMALGTGEIEAYYIDRLAGLRESVGLLTAMGRAAERVNELEIEIANTEAQLQAVRDLESYTPDLLWRRATCLERMERYPEGYWAFVRLIDAYPGHAQVENYLYAAFTQALKAAMIERAVDLALRYLDNPGFERYAEEVSIQLGELYLAQEDVARFHELADRFITTNPESRYTAQFAYHIGTRRIRAEEYERLLEQFDDYAQRFPQSPMMDGLHYWRGMASLFVNAYDTGREHFATVTNSFPTSSYFEDARFRIGVCAFGSQDFPRARNHFASFVDTYPDSVLRGEAEVFLGDIAASDARVEDALDHYRRIEEFTDNIGFITHGYFQSGELLEANGRHDEMVRIFERYINRFRERGEITAAFFQLGRAHELRGHPEEMIAVYLSAIERFGNSPRAYGIDDILAAYPEKYREIHQRIVRNLAFRDRLLGDPAFRRNLVGDRRFQWETFREWPLVDADFRTRLQRDEPFRESIATDDSVVRQAFAPYAAQRDAFPREPPSEILGALLERAARDGRETLRWRLRQALDSLGQPVADDLIITERAFPNASPASLVWIARQLATRDPALAEDALRFVLAEHPDADAVNDALIALGDLHRSERRMDQALVHYARSRERFPASDRATEAALKQGRTLLDLTRGDDALSLFQDILRTRGISGDTKAETQFLIGRVHEERGEHLKAHGYFQRVYIAYPHFHEWAARAYLHSGLSLERLGREEDARRTYEEFLANSDLAGTSVHSDVLRRLNRLDS